MKSLTGNLNLILQIKKGNSWVNHKMVTDENVTIPSNGLIKLDIGGNYGWNLKNVSVNSPGQYRIYGELKNSDGMISSSWEFNVQ
ncbi:hypothetical protein CO037_00290 [Candidatus Pacearchaeota archaeon CG_4_9_14_0_2_um_filter_30_8]|nr:MAG: hypothetical protein CO037_00290 [Candidatus Pacearchaeota archaeon CG_4_9_14_0_2_um_filter_30_8]